MHIQWYEQGTRSAKPRLHSPYAGPITSSSDPRASESRDPWHPNEKAGNCARDCQEHRRSNTFFSSSYLVLPMHHAEQFTAFLVVAYGLAFSVWPALRWSECSGWMVLCVSGVVMFTPLAIHPRHIMLRALAAVLAIDLSFKITDFRAAVRRSPDAAHDFFTYCRFLAPFPVLLVRLSKRTRWSGLDLRHGWPTVFASLGFGACCVLLERLWHVPVLRSSFLLDHTVKFALFAVAIEVLARLIHSLEQLAGYATEPIIQDAYQSTTIADFWRRFNTRVHAWFKANVFPLLNRKRAPVRSLLLTFFVSGLLHEVGFAVATSRIDGYQFMFFMLQASAIVFSHYARRRVAESTIGSVVSRCGTVAWLWGTSMLFFHGVNRVFPWFYASTPWLP